MDILIGLAILAGLILAGWGWHRLKAATRKKLNQTVFQRGSHEQGQQITSEQLSLSSGRTPAEILAAVRARLDLPSTPGALPRLYLAATGEQALVFGQGSKLGENFRATLALEPSSAGSTGQFAVLNWTEVDGIVGHLDDLKYLRHMIERAIREADPDVQFNVTPT